MKALNYIIVGLAVIAVLVFGFIFLSLTIWSPSNLATIHARETTQTFIGPTLRPLDPTTVVITHTVEYQVIGTANSASITYANMQGGTEQGDYKLPIKKKWTFHGDIPDGTFLYISAQNDGESGTVTCQILIDGEVWKTSTSKGAYVICTASGRFGW